MKFIGSSTVNTVAKLAYKDYKKYADAVDSVITKMSTDVFYPNDSGISVYKGTNIKIIVDFVEQIERNDLTSTQTQIITTKKVNGWNKNQLQDNFTEIIKSYANSDMQTIIKNWNYDTKIRGIKPLKDYFWPSSNVMYGNTNSLIIPYSTDINSSTLNSFSFNDPITANSGTLSKSKDQRWAEIINWDGYSIKTERTRNRDIILNRRDDFWDEDYKSAVEGDRTGGGI